jgi:hypothetical protein
MTKKPPAINGEGRMDEIDSKRLQRIDANVRLIADILVSVVAFGLALCVAELIDHFSYWEAHAYSWPAAIGLMITLWLEVATGDGSRSSANHQLGITSASASKGEGCHRLILAFNIFRKS